MNNYKRFRFTMAHELAHHILHAKLFKQNSIQSVGESMNTLPDESRHIMAIISSDSSKLEYQANMFASCLLMPKKLVYYMYYYFYQRYEGRNIKILYYSPNQPETWQNHNKIVGNMARLLDVSLQAMSIRLESLGLLTIKY